MKLDQLLESHNTPIIIVDYQPAYDKWIRQYASHDMPQQLMAYLNEHNGPVLAYYNGNESSLDERFEVFQYYIENGLKEDKLEDIEFTSKMYGWLRQWTDAEVPPDIIIKTLRFMYQHRLGDSREITLDDYRSFLDENDIQNWEKYLTGDSGAIWVPNEISLAKLKTFNKGYICGGGRHACLQELELTMSAFNIKYKRLERFIF